MSEDDYVLVEKHEQFLAEIDQLRSIAAELAGALEALHGDEWRCTVDWGNRDERQVILDNCAVSLARYQEMMKP